ncbi:MAG: heavy metal translocating P-type ATPase metal-binding domain-containing protein [Flavobacteriales bacterium]|nr:heavy metal translocating P-type ATPase metal-binding domain-containing protein [Flavobacteriales bacterium]
MESARQQTQTVCYHCGEVCKEDLVMTDDHAFCCDGCKVVYELLKENNLCSYYSIDQHAGISPKLKNFQGRFNYLDDPVVQQKLIRFNDGETTVVVFSLPQMHCSSCVWLLEHLYKLDEGISQSRTEFLRKEITIHYNPQVTTMRKVVELLTTLGYEPLLSLDNLSGKEQKSPQRVRVYRIAVAGFCFANIMMLSFPEYFHITEEGDHQLQTFFSYLNLAISLPVLIYSGGEFFQSAWQSLRAKFLNIDVPLVLSILITFVRSVYEIVSGTGAGYLDSMSGIIFFMLVGRYFQEKTHHALQFDRNYKSFFPISIMLRKGKETEESIPLTNLSVGDVMVIHSQELVPADSKLLSDEAHVDYSFVTGESAPVKIRKGELIYAGGKQTGGAIECEVLREVSQSYLTGLWNRDAFNKGEKVHTTFIDRLARNFTIFLLALSVGGFFYWLPTDMTRGLNALTTVLIVACPCALLLSATFTNGAIMRIFSRNKFYLKNPAVIESLAKVDHIVLDKTGTITNNVIKVKFYGDELGEVELEKVYSLVRHSNHPLSKSLTSHLSFCDARPVTDYVEIPGSGLSGRVDGIEVKIGNAAFCDVDDQSKTSFHGARVHVVILGHYAGYFGFERSFRTGAPEVIDGMKSAASLSFLSGDNEAERESLQKLAGANTPMFFHQTPENKMDYVKSLQDDGAFVAMVGDGLNDSGALQQSQVGIAVSDDVNNFSPACDAILEGSAFGNLDRLFQLAKHAQRIILASFGLSLLYNVVGLSFAVTGTLSPVVAAILMPISSISIILFTNGLSHLSALKLKLNH